VKVTKNRQVALQPISGIAGEIQLAGSKYIANRQLITAALAQTPSHLRNVVINDDINATINCLNALGYRLQRQGELVMIRPRSAPCARETTLDTQHSGTLSRFICALAARESVPVRIECSKKMATRPMAPLFAALRQLGVTVNSDNERLPATIIGPVKGKRCRIDASKSSQFVSALILLGASLPDGLTIELQGELVSSAYLLMTMDILAEHGVRVKQQGSQILVKPNRALRGVDKVIPADPVSASYFMAIPAIVGGSILIRNFDFEGRQGEVGFVEILRRMGLFAERRGEDLYLHRTQTLSGIEVDLGEMPDVVQTLAAIACFAKTPTYISNIAHLAYKESDRIADTAKELRKAGLRVENDAQSLRIYPGQPQPCILDSHDDHRMAMSLALLGLKAEDIFIDNAMVVSKSFPDYWQRLQQLGIGLNWR